MTFANFRLNIVIRVFGMIVFMGLGSYCLVHTQWIVTPLVLFVLVGIVVLEMIHYIEKTNREFTGFLLSIKNTDFSRPSISETKGKTFRDFREALQVVADALQEVRTEKEANYIFLQTVVSDLNTALIAFDNRGEIKLMNDAARNLLHVTHLRNINALGQTNAVLADYLTSLKPSDNDILEVRVNGESLKLSGRSVPFNVQGIDHQLVSIQDIRSELDATEAEAWEQLLHVLTHEIMNSITPVSSLSATLVKKATHLVNDYGGKDETMIDLSEGLQVIARRSAGLINFVNHYKTLINLPAPVVRLVKIDELFERIILLTTARMKAANIQLIKSPVDQSMYIKADPEQMEQVMLNLVNNAADALTEIENPRIELNAYAVVSRTIIEISDNGKGFDQQTADKLFVPFFTTKQQGSGIGLSLSRQIMRRHGGSINIQSSQGKLTVCKLEFP